jgi:quercetin dioxygenase-like cupin family protein
MQRVRGSFFPILVLGCLTISLHAQVPRNNLDVHRQPNRSAVSEPLDVKLDHCFHQVLVNDRVRVFSLELAPHQSTELDSHNHDYVFLSLGKSNFQISGNGATYPMQLDDGEMQVLKGRWPHQIANLSETFLHLLELEVLRDVHPDHPLCGLGGKECTDGRFGNSDEGRYTQNTLFETDTIKLDRIELGPSGVLPEHRHEHCHVLIALDEIEFRDENHDGDRDLHLKSGEALWYADNVVHRLKNLDKENARLVTLEFK